MSVSKNTATSEAPVAGSIFTHWPAAAASSADLKLATVTQLATLLNTILAIPVANISDASANGRSLIAAADYAAMRQLLRLTPLDAGAITSTPTVLAPDTDSFGTMGADGEVTLGSPSEGSRTTIKLTVTGERTLKHPAAKRIGTNTTPTSTVLAAGFHKLIWEYADSAWWQTDVGE